MTRAGQIACFASLLLGGCAMDLLAPDRTPQSGGGGADAAPGELGGADAEPGGDDPADATSEEPGPDAAGDPVPQTILIPRGTTWRYLDDGSDQGDAWHLRGFDDGLWATGGAELGYGDGDEVTVVDFGPDPAAKYVTTYFRHRVEIADPTVFDTYTLGLRVDDGAVVYLNGTEVARVRLAEGATITFETRASDAPDEGVYATFELPSAGFRAGGNLIAIEVHQAGAASSDLSFDVELVAAQAP